MDALTVALTDEKAVKRLNDLNKHLRDWVKKKYEKGDLELDPDEGDLLDAFLKEESDIRNSALKEVERFRNIPEPWKGFQNDARKALEEIIVSHKPKDKLLLQYEDIEKNGKINKQRVIKIRGPLHEDYIYGIQGNLETKRIALNKLSDPNMSKSAAETNLRKICNDYLRETVWDHYKNIYKGNKKDAFGPEGILGLNKRLAEKKKIKNGKEEHAPHPPISSVKIYRKKPKSKGKNKISLQKIERTSSYNNNVYVVSGENYLLAILERDEKRIYDSISLIEAVELIRNEFNNAENKTKFSKDRVLKEYFELRNNASFLFSLSKNDLIYVPNQDEEIPHVNNHEEWKNYWKDSHLRANNIYSYIKVTTHPQHWFIKHDIAQLIENYSQKDKFGELSSQNAIESIDGINIKSVCYPIKLDRLGNIIEVNGIPTK